MQRRTFLKSLGALSVLTYMPRSWGQEQNADQQGRLILVQLGGGNDSLNTFVPFTDASYYQARPNLAIAKEQVLAITNSLGLHPAMAPLMQHWQSGEMALVEGLGYANPNRSHFRGYDIWHTASDAEEILSEGWLAQVMDLLPMSLDALVLSGSPGAFAGGADLFNLAGQTDIASFSPAFMPSGSSDISSLQFILDSRAQYNASLESLESVLAQAPEPTVTFPNTAFGQQCELISRLITGGLDAPLWHLSLGSFDTHANQADEHAALLTELAEGLAALCAALKADEQWSDTTIASYSEFGRRVGENASLGTDHGTAASHFVLGGNVQGGLFGQRPSLTELDAGDLIFTTDFRHYYKSLLQKAGLPISAQLQEYVSLGF
ncbi:DUF1501 domain-containing protein [Aliiglaciecola sp. CAU 1673]|uniref:DUF1501 domain-containing protein n=1 Tax=Aliiglaciecola sp. CAU 1673 TaxID=3032595 RepID=UPI0023DA7588|nr:DUF1501 domain-containing protein [Aliiglaciecola sp. CAU 1673]MDF2176890.1 DUF1501 domain-containing protein [Aliiglaciecola sp. CAU 1673]